VIRLDSLALVLKTLCRCEFRTYAARVIRTVIVVKSLAILKTHAPK